MNQLVATAPSFSVNDVEKVATAIAKGGLFGSKDPMAVLTLCLLAQAEGQHPAVVFRDYHIINGKPAKKAEAMLRDFISAGGKVEWHTMTDTQADATFSHPYGGSARIDWDHKRAQTAGLAGNAMYKKYPRQMLRSRVISEGVRSVFPGATSGLYVEEEVSTFDTPAPSNDAHTGEIIDATATEAPAKVEGITKIKERLRVMRTAGDRFDITLEEFRQLVRDNRDDLKTIRDANHSWWTGDGEDFEGYGAWKERRVAELEGTFGELVRSMKECTSRRSLANWRGANEALIMELDDAQGRSFDLAYNLFESALNDVALVTEGA